MRNRTFLFMPGNNPGMLASAQCLGADVVIFDLEDAVAQTEKDAARILVSHALTELRPQGVGVTVRINGLDTPYWQADMEAVVAAGTDFVMVPKIESADQMLQVTTGIESARQKCGSTATVKALAIIETPLGLENAHAIASASKILHGILLGAEDFTASMGAQRTADGAEIAYARSRLLTACKAAGVLAIDTPFPFVADLERLEKDAAFAVQLGFDGKAVISPHHVHRVNQAFMPAPEKVNWAQRVMAAARKASEEGKGAVSLDGMMIDLPIIKRAERILLLADA
ncbi:HpcH/HpaI aldolase/citrate lyase family protein [Desulfovibrio intestinalis]|uniref:Citrate lyase subunit beta/citryl-CoA lyase n=1 Tax=Desulfovibrio intestinalis TaxID=58621 RepID=A0A7W8FDV3_9BACT|nr:CoA ester lyase [Desulfovibrio intestinalis]MBB5142113.1 citrate lyase subunit beta/citryl-CoA lyase [Desulfovibrio intestinalis]